MQLNAQTIKSELHKYNILLICHLLMVDVVIIVTGLG